MVYVKRARRVVAFLVLILAVNSMLVGCHFNIVSSADKTSSAKTKFDGPWG
jgi:hypothetical protein